MKTYTDDWREKGKGRHQLQLVFMRVLCPGQIGIKRYVLYKEKKTGEPGEKRLRVRQ